MVRININQKAQCWLELLRSKICWLENINIVEYKENVLHGRHFNAYDLNTDTGKKYTSILGQRLLTITLLLTDNLTINFPSIKTSCNLNQCDLLIYKNVMLFIISLSVFLFQIMYCMWCFCIFLLSSTLL